MAQMDKLDKIKEKSNCFNQDFFDGSHLKFIEPVAVQHPIFGLTQFCKSRNVRDKLLTETNQREL